MIRVMRRSVLAIWILTNAVALILLVNPWFTTWRTQAAVLLILELVFLVVIGLPVFLYHFVRKKRPIGQSLSDSVETVLDFLTGWV